MSSTEGDRLRGALRGVDIELGRGPDIADVRRRVERKLRNKRLSAAGIGLLLAGVAVGTAVALAPLGRGNIDRRPGSAAAGPFTDVQTTPEGRLLVQLGPDRALVVGQDSRVLARDARLLTLSPDGTRVLIEEVDNDPRLLTVSIAAAGQGSEGVILEIAKGLSLQPPIDWSDDGAHILYTQAPQDKPETRTMCIVAATGGNSQCFPQLGRVFSADWSPVEDAILIGTQADTVELFDYRTGQTSVLIHADDDAVVGALTDAGFSDVVEVQFVEPQWSPSGAYVATQALVQGSNSLGYVPLVFDPSGDFVARGDANADFMSLAWSPTRDVLAYNTGVLAEPPEGTWAAYLLDPE
ncbi:MAG: hypothetical protein ACREA0_09535, partial [bacterium]